MVEAGHLAWEHQDPGARSHQPDERCQPVCRHHERYDGKGYPDGLAGENIPWVARIIAVADTFDAMSSTRPYRKRLPEDFIISEIKNCAGTQLDPKVVQKFLELYETGAFADVFSKL